MTNHSSYYIYRIPGPGQSQAVYPNKSDGKRTEDISKLVNNSIF